MNTLSTLLQQKESLKEGGGSFSYTNLNQENIEKMVGCLKEVNEGELHTIRSLKDITNFTGQQIIDILFALYNSPHIYEELKYKDANNQRIAERKKPFSKCERDVRQQDKWKEGLYESIAQENLARRMGIHHFVNHSDFIYLFFTLGPAKMSNQGKEWWHNLISHIGKQEGAYERIGDDPDYFMAIGETYDTPSNTIGESYEGLIRIFQEPRAKGSETIRKETVDFILYIATLTYKSYELYGKSRGNGRRDPTKDYSREEHNSDLYKFIQKI